MCLTLNSLIEKYPVTFDVQKLEYEYYKVLKDFSKKIVVLDDDPTGVQTVHGVPVYTDWTLDTIRAAFSRDEHLFFVLTNSRSFSSKKTIEVHAEISKHIVEAARETGKDFVIISRSDSTLRGHYPIETQILKETIQENSMFKIDGEILIPFFLEGDRFTANNIHYVQYGKKLIPAAETEFAKDKTFGYANSHLGKWIEEKTEGKFKEQDISFITLEQLRTCNIDLILETLLNVDNFNKVVVNALDEIDLKVFVIALIKALNLNKRFIFRTAASFVKVFGAIEQRALLTKNDLLFFDTKEGGIVIVGSHVQKTTEQLAELKKCDFIEFIEFNQHLVLSPVLLQNEEKRVMEIATDAIMKGKTAVIYTRRERIDLNTGNKEEELEIAVRISDALSRIVRNLSVRPAFIIAKGGITSSDIGTKGLGVKKAIVAGQIKPGVPVWITGEESKFPRIPYIIFPGNVGTKETLREVIEILSSAH